MILPEKSSGISLSCQTLRRSPSCPLIAEAPHAVSVTFMSAHYQTIPVPFLHSKRAHPPDNLHGNTLSYHNPSVGITQIRYGRRSIFLSACHTSSRWLFSFLFFNIAHTYPVVKPPLLIALCTPAGDFHKSYFEISSIRRSSSAVNGAQWIAFTLSRICCGLEAPMSTLVTSLC